ncbi:hypothetical protein CIB93_03730 [Streptomyces sp. WZ.A104]|uniref:ParB/RepB/Spo0J family partition protein n=1 Tax=Streptomyces sp. WZ.A104 TaxID=2023771 RepID=UPI000BBBA7BE|nr:ParB/RepB/Spo0J family partition protein [Streptomyces sp. WZ.A104]PCG87279.1 hypothetical protein CIB93_03730 [Streptomyces sp. WZ.A104]
MSDGLADVVEDSEYGRGTELVSVDALHVSGRPRVAAEDTRHTRALADSDVPLPPIVVHRPTMRVVDGFHRLRATVLRGEERIRVSFVEGTLDEAFVLAVRVNTRQGMPLSHADRTAAAARLVESHPQWSDRRIAEIACLSPTTVAALRSRSTGRRGQLNARAGRDGRVRPLDADAARGRRRAALFIGARPEASLREVAAVAGVAVATARDVRARLRAGESPLPPKLRAAEREGVPDDGAAAPASARGAEEAPARGTEEAFACGTEERSPTAAGPSPTGGGRCVVQMPQRFAHPAVPNLRKDPSLRFTEAGRTLLRLWSAHSMDAQRWRWLAGGVPAHRLGDAVWAAQQCADQWRRFARDLEIRAAEGRDRTG